MPASLTEDRGVPSWRTQPTYPEMVPMVLIHPPESNSNSAAIQAAAPQSTYLPPLGEIRSALLPPSYLEEERLNRQEKELQELQNKYIFRLSCVLLVALAASVFVVMYF